MALLLVYVACIADVFPSTGGKDAFHYERPGRLIQGEAKRYRVSSEAHGTHYFMTTSAIPLDRGVGYYKNTLVMLNSGAYAITSNLAISAGVDLFSLITSRTGTLWYSRIQVSGSLGEMVHVGAQVFYTSLPLPLPPALAELGDPPTGFATGLGMITIGNAVNQITLSGGWAHDGEQAGRGPILNASGMVRVAANVALVTEHWLFVDPIVNYPMHSFGMRVVGDHLAIDVGLAYDRVLAAKVLPIGLPFASATLNF